MTGPSATGAWQLGLVEEVDLPGWVWLPEDVDDGQRDGWLDEISPAVLELIASRGNAGDWATAADVRAVLESGLEARSQSPSYLMYLVFPVHAPAGVMCHVNLVPVQDLPAWDEFRGRMQPAEARHLGPGVQISAEVSARTDHGEADLRSVVYVFADRDTAVVVSLEPSFPELIGQTVLTMQFLLDAIAVARPDGSEFRADPTTAPIVTADPWPMDAEDVS